MVYGRRPGQPYAGNEAGTEVDHPAIDSRYVGVGVEHGNHYRRRKGEYQTVEGFGQDQLARSSPKNVPKIPVDMSRRASHIKENRPPGCSPRGPVFNYERETHATARNQNEFTHRDQARLCFVM